MHTNKSLQRKGRTRLSNSNATMLYIFQNPRLSVAQSTILQAHERSEFHHQSAQRGGQPPDGHNPGSRVDGLHRFRARAQDIRQQPARLSLHLRVLRRRLETPGVQGRARAHNERVHFSAVDVSSSPCQVTFFYYTDT